MKTIPLTDAAGRFDDVVKAALRNPITITGDGEGAVVMLSAAEYAGMTETLHLFSTTANAERIGQALADYEAGTFQQGDLF